MGKALFILPDKTKLVNKKRPPVPMKEAGGGSKKKKVQFLLFGLKKKNGYVNTNGFCLLIEEVGKPYLI